MVRSRLVAPLLAGMLSLAPVSPSPDLVRAWEFADGPFVADATVRLGGAVRDGAGARFTVEKGGLITVAVQVCGPSAACPADGGTPALTPHPSPIGNAVEPSGLFVAAHLTADPRAFTVVGGGFEGEQTVGAWDTATWSWTLRADARGEHVLAVQVAAWRVTDRTLVGDGAPVEMAVETSATVRDLVQRRIGAGWPGLALLFAVVIVTIAAVLVVRRRRVRQG